MRQLFQSYIVIIAIVMNACVWAGITLSRTYIDILFLSTYPTSYLPYFFMGQTIVILAITLSLTLLSGRNSSVMNVLIFSGSALSILVGQQFLGMPGHWVIFGFCLWLSAIPIILTVVSLNIIADAFDVRRFKQTVLWINVAGNLGGLGMGLLTPLLIRLLGTEALIYILAVVILAASVASWYLKPLPALPRKTSQGQSPFNYNLFRIIAICTFLMMIIDTFADYAVKSQVSLNYTVDGVTDKEAIGSFMGIFYGVSNVLMLIFQVAGTQLLLTYTGVIGLLIAVPVFCSAASIFMLALPGLAAAVFVRLGQNALRFSFFSTGREIALKPLPAQIRRAGKFLITAAGYIGSGLGAILLWLFAERLGLMAVAVLIMLVAAAWIAVAFRVGKAYQGTLEEAIKIKRFNAGTDIAQDEFFVEHQDDVQKMVQLAFQEKDPDAIRFGFTLLERFNIETLPEIALPHLYSDNVEVRAEFVKAACRLGDETVTAALRERLKVEDDGKVIWWTYKTFLKLAPTEVVDIAETMITHERPLARAGAVVVLLTYGDLDQIIQAANMLRTMLYSNDFSMRRGAAYAISALKRGNFDNELRRLLNDESDVVAISAMWAVEDQKNARLLPTLAAMLGQGRTSRSAMKTLVELGAPAVPALVQVIHNGNIPQMRAAVRALVTIQAEEADEAIIDAARHPDVMMRTQLAKDCAMQAKYRPRREFLAAQAIQFVCDEADIIRILRDARLAPGLPGPVQLELAHRRKMAESRLLYWFDICTESVELLGVIPAILSEKTSAVLASKHATALEFLDTQTNDPVLKSAISVFEEAPNESRATEALANLSKLGDSWLDRVLAAPLEFNAGKNMDITAKVMLLRKVQLFAQLPGEVLLTIAETCEDREMVKGERIVSEGDAPDGMYIVASGQINVQRGADVINELKEYDFFGEIGLFDDSPRMADVVAQSDGMLLFLEKEVFDGITEDLPEVLRALVRTVIGYLK
ncbi:MAG: cyclic nucleotide-binding domain-containing protein [Pseudomonadota bacterium]